MSENKTILNIQSSLEMVGFVKANGNQCRFVSLITETPVKNIKAACPFKGVMKISKKMGMINVNFAEAVRRKVAEKFEVKLNEVDNYVPGDVWYKHLTTADGKNLPIVVNKTKDDGEYYLQYFPTTSTNVYQMPDGSPVQEEQLKPYFYAKKESEFKPVVISIKVSNIKRLAASGVIMQADDLEEAEQALLSAQ